ncbi:MAG: H+/gluconate symporter [Microbacterium sp.]|nr:H+/gluconate symporter [Microbacterium sp.]
MEDWTQTLGTTPLLLIAAGAIALILVLIIWLKVHAFLALIIVSLVTAFAAGIPVSAVVKTLTDGFGGTLGTVALLVALGAMLGRLIEHSGGAQALADTFVRVFGEKRAPFALGIVSLILGFPMFFDAGLVMMLPIIFAIARRVSGNNVLLFGLPAAAAFSVMHVFLPPHPGPVSASELYGANLGIVLIVGLIVAFPIWYLSGYLWGKFVAKRIVLPVTGLTTLGAAGVVDTDNIVVQVLVLLGNSPVALLITVLVATVVFGFRRGENGTALEKVVDSALGPVASVILITGAGGMFGAVLRASGIGDALADSLSDLGLPVIVAAYIIAVILRLAQGSATVALVTAAGLAAPAVMAGDFSPLQIAAITLATAAGSVFAGHVNDSGFWLVGRLMGMDVKTTLKTWTVQQAIESVLGFLAALAVFGIGGLL